MTRHRPAAFRRAFPVLALLLGPVSWTCRGAATEPAPPAAIPAEDTNSLQLVQTCRQLQEQLQVTRLTLERNHQEATAAAAQSADALFGRLRSMQETFSTERAREWAAMQKSNQIMLIMAGTFAGIGVLTMLIMTWFQWRMSSRLAGIAAAWPAAPGLTQGSTVSELAAGDSSRVQGGSVAQPELRLLPAIEQLKKRIHGLEQGARAGLASGEGARSSGGNGAPSDSDLEAGSVDLATMDGPARVAALLREARARLNADDTPAALACLDKVLALAPNHGEALVKKGAALERLHRLNEAIECYDRAIAADGAMTIAYLHKGGLCKRLERFKEALECYEEALRRHDGCSG